MDVCDYHGVIDLGVEEFVDLAESRSAGVYDRRLNGRGLRCWLGILVKRGQRTRGQEQGGSDPKGLNESFHNTSKA
jgi:hypothetical protein